MSSVDERVVKMEFENAAFMKKAADSEKALGNLNKAVDNSGKSKGLLSLDNSMQKVSVTASKMAVITTTALATITNKAVNAGIALTKSLTWGPMMDGFHEYESLLTKQNVIMNATGQSATKVKSILNELNTYSDKTIYSFGNMTDAITQFVNAGIPLDKSVESIKGIANAAAFAGASAEEANRSMYAFTQMMQVGHIMLQDWRQVENAQMGTVQFKNTLLDTAVAVGTLTKKGDSYITKTGKTISATKGWNDGLKEQWATSEVLTKALSKYADTSTELGKKAFESATKVRTFTAFMDTLKESIGSGWAGIFTELIGGLDRATKFWTGLSNVIGGVVGGFFNFGQQTLYLFRMQGKLGVRLGGMGKIIHGIGNILAPVGALIQAFGDAWRDVFPGSGAESTAKGLYKVASAFYAMTLPLKWLADHMPAIVPILATFFRIFRIGGAIIKAGLVFVADFVKALLGLVNLKAPSSGGFINYIKIVAREIGGAIKQVDDLLSKGKSLTEAFGSVNIKLPSIPKMPSLGGLFGGGTATNSATPKMALLTAGVKNLTNVVGDLNKASDETDRHMMFNPKAKLDNSRFRDVSDQFSSLASSVTDSGKNVETVGDKMGGTVSKLKTVIGSFIKSINFDDIVSSFNLAILATFMISISRFFNTLTKSFKGFIGTGEAINGILENAGSALKSFQTQARAKLILNIAIAIGILAASLLVLSLIPADKMTRGLYAMGTMMTFLVLTIQGLTKALSKLDGVKVAAQLVALSVAIVALGAGMLLLAAAFAIMDHVGWQGVAKGLTTIAVVLASITALGKFANKSGKTIASAAASILLISLAMGALAGALLLFKLIKWEDMGKAGAALGGLALAVGVLALIPYEGIAKVGVALLTASAGMIAMASALLLFGQVKWSGMIKAGVALAALTASIAVLMALGGPVAISGVLAIGGAMVLLATGALIMNKVNWSAIGKAAVVLTLLVAAFAAFVGIAYLAAPVLVILSFFAGQLALLAVAITALTVAFSIMMPLLAAGVGAFAALATGAAVAVAVFLQTLASEAPIMKDAILKMLQAGIDTLVEGVPMIIRGIKDLWNAIKKEFQGDDKKGAMSDSSKSWMDKLKQGISDKIPELVNMAGELIMKFLRGLSSKASAIGGEGAKFIARFIEGVAAHLGEVVTAGTHLIIQWIQGMTRAYGDIAIAAADAVIQFIHRMADAIRTKGPELGSAMGDLGVAMVQGLIGGIGSMFGEAMGKIGELAEGMVAKAKSILKIFSPSKVFYAIGKFLVTGLTNGIQNNAAAAITAVASMVGGQIAVASEYISKFIQQLDQQSIAARGRAEGLALAAAKAAKAAKQTKSKADDKAADRLQKNADKASKKADAAEAKAQRAKDAQDRREQFNNATYLERAQMRSEDAQNQLAASKQAEQNAAKNLAAAQALTKQARTKGVSAKERKNLLAQAAALRAQAEKDAKNANTQLANARTSAADALKWQKLAGDQAAALFQEQFDGEAKAAKEAAEFEKLSNEEKAKAREKQAAELQAKADADLAKAKKLAYTDLEAANALAQQAMDEAQQARQYLDDAASYSQAASQGGGVGTGQVVNLDPTEAAALALNRYSDLYDAATAAAARGKTVEFNQYNYSPEALSPSEVFRQTHNQLNFAADKLADAAA